MHDALLGAYGPQHWWPAETAFEVVLGAYLTQNTSWKAVERSLANLRQAGALTPDGARALALEDLKILIRPSGFHTRKAPALKAFVAMLDEEFGGSLEGLAAAPTATIRLRLRTRFCCTPSTTRSRWPMNTFAASPSATSWWRQRLAAKAMNRWLS